MKDAARVMRFVRHAAVTPVYIISLPSRVEEMYLSDTF